MSVTVESLAAELRALRKGRGINAADIERRLGPHLTQLISRVPGQDVADRRRTLITELGRCAATLAVDLRLAITASLAISGDARLMSHHKDRVGWLAVRLGVNVRTALRRVDAAELLLAEELAVQLRRHDSPSAPASDGWFLDELRTLLRLDTRTPESHEHRRIVATRDGVQDIAIDLDLPADSDQPRSSLSAEVLYGGRLIRQDQPFRNRFRLLIRLPAPLTAGAIHEYGLILRLPDGQPMRPHYIFTPECLCKNFLLRVRFDPRRLPAWVRRVDGETVRVFEQAALRNDALAVDAVGEVAVQFTSLAMYLGYGAQWLP